MALTTERVEFSNGIFTAELLPASEAEGWQVGSIDPGMLDNHALEALGRSVLASISPVAPEELPYSDCTDGRFRVGLADGSAEVPLREKIVGADTVTGLAMAEALGDKFYGNDKATIAERIDEVVSYLKENDIIACTHGHCGAAGGFVPVSQNIITFSADPNYRARQAAFVPVYDAALYDKMVNNLGARLDSGAYQDYGDGLITAAVTQYGGGCAVAEYRDDGQGVKGHRELLIARLQGFAGQTVDPNRLATIAEGAQVFSVNDDRIARLAALFGRGNDEDYATAYMAGEAFTDAGHGTLGKNLRTLIIRPETAS